MSIRGGVQQMRETFEAQFERLDGKRYVYRRNQKGAPIPVTAEERERFVRQYIKRIWLVMGGMMGGLLVFVGVAVWWTIATGTESQGSDLPHTLLYCGTLIIIAVAVGLMFRINGAPARELAARAPVGSERSRAEMRAIGLKKITYGQLAGAAVVAIFLPFTQLSERDVFHGWGRLWLLFSAAILLLAAFQAFRKWKYDRDHGKG